MRKQTRRTLTALLAVMLSATVASTASAGDLVTNGSFEAVQIGSPFVTSDPADIPGWTRAAPPVMDHCGPLVMPMEAGA